MSLLADIARRNLAERVGGVYAVCSAHPFVIGASLRRALADGTTALIEATCNQVNQRGGYTGMTAEVFRREVLQEAARLGLPPTRVIFGGDHLGPYPWRRESAERAMDQAKSLVASYVSAGFEKIHLDTSMACAGDPNALACELVAARSAALCRVCEEAARERRQSERPVYVIGTEVPTPGGSSDVKAAEPTTIASVTDTWEAHRRAFHASGLASAWERVIAVVVQPGVEFGNTHVVDFEPARARELSRLIEDVGSFVFEAHSTDYQRPDALRALVEGHFAVLKVGPALTFAMREALFALAAIEDEIVPADERSGLRARLEEAMLADPSHWASHYAGTPDEQRLARAYSLSDRCRYYWTKPEVEAAVAALLTNLMRQPPPWTLLSQHLPLEAESIRARAISSDARSLLQHRIEATLDPYARACAPDAEAASPGHALARPRSSSFGPLIVQSEGRP